MHCWLLDLVFCCSILCGTSYFPGPSDFCVFGNWTVVSALFYISNIADLSLDYRAGMTRFARARGSKSSNKREPEEATPWTYFFVIILINYVMADGHTFEHKPHSTFLT
ncbi:uncharacterized protein LOC103524243 [Diaphorina citri]|uniref:Uncharacterized protein LOC103524243 n=1 Tax=Diaphorina citri TaxID=121845 RepID=A0A1S3DU27_DIACI|nr:uncharacterized protein LOC103524243 [Diaphorina citri]